MASRTRVLTGLDGQRYHFDAGVFCLELLLTGGPGPIGEAYEILFKPDDLAEWLLDSRLNDTAPVRREDLDITESDLAHVTQFRNALWHAAEAMAKGQAPEKSHLEVINGAVGEPPRPQIDVATLQRHWAAPITGRQIAAMAAREAIDLVGSTRLRQCAGDNCALLFLDTSRPGKRRWCSMERCGNRNKVREFRSRSGATS
ncbi:CGNR zinc finger domain-containing protein [Kibdelosporangium aridum]|uniref:CGNR zinc finger domain-containing protein n=1 Tax=Kibdelosporangium aridum TaxID=2030 RepID=UPI0009FE619D|nr:CGNR zinc finger domain-containing protein [Kibdelosporangium aridum]